MGRLRLSTQIKTKVSLRTNLTLIAATGISISIITGVCIYFYLNFLDSGSTIAQDSHQKFNYHFGNSTGSLKSGSSTTFLPVPESGMAFALVSNGAGMDLMNPGNIDLGTDSELKMSLGGNKNGFAKMSIVDFEDGSSFYTKFKIKISGTSGEWFFVQGSGTSFTNGSDAENKDVFTGIRFNNELGKISVSNMKNNKWESLRNVLLTTDVVYEIEVFGNNTKSAISYKNSDGAGCVAKTVGGSKWDMWIDGQNVGSNMMNGNLSHKDAANSFMFYGQNSSSSSDVMAIDDIVYTGSIPTSTLEHPFQPELLVFTKIDYQSINISFSEAVGEPNGYLILRKEDSPSSAVPIDFVTYKIGDVIGDAVVAYIGPDVDFTDVGLMPGTEYFYRIFSYDGDGTCRNYTQTMPLEGSQRTLYNNEFILYRSVSNGNWDDPSVWVYEHAPGQFSPATSKPGINNRVIISTGHIITSNSAYLSNLKIETKGQLYVDGNLTIVKGGSSIEKGVSSIDFQNDGTLSITGSFDVEGVLISKDDAIVEFCGNKEQIIPAGTYKNINLKNGNKRLSGNIEVFKSIKIDNSIVKTGDHFVQLKPGSQLLNESNTSYIDGNIEANESIFGNSSDFGGIGVVIDASFRQQDLGNVKVIRSNKLNENIFTESIGKQWHIIPEYEPTDEVTLSLTWLKSDEIEGLATSKLQFYKSTDNGTSWLPMGQVQDGMGRTISAKVGSFSIWTVGNGLNAMPVTFVDFKAEKSGTDVLLTWYTAVEISNLGFEVEKSYDAKDFEKIAFVEGNGTSYKINSYQIKVSGSDRTTYFRLRQIDIDGKFDYSKTVSIGASEMTKEKIFTVYPNPVINQISIKSKKYIDPKENLKVDLYDLNGNIVFSVFEKLELINDLLTQQILHMARGQYIMSISYQGHHERIAILKK